MNNKIYMSDGSSKIYYSDSALQAQSMTVIANHCLSCHGSNSSGGFSGITNVEHLISGKYISPGKASSSLLIQVIENGSMPPSGALTGSEIDTLKAWVNSFVTSTPPSDPTDPGAIPLRATFTSINANILNRCISCHSPSGSRPQSNFTSYASVIASGAVVAGFSNSSSMYLKTLDYSMPKNSPANILSYAELAVLKTWIDAGANND